ncbi:MAG TPA: M3 family oligoendopeptidase [candidate division Zixibacteria bacterium]|nr:M3 family oligoendopeptidase [candidate division Zixibacteria bacterium]
MASRELANLPRWDLSNIYPGLESETLALDRQKLDDQLTDLETFASANQISADGHLHEDPVKAAQIIGAVLDRLNAAGGLYETLENYLYGFVATDSYNKEATRLTSLLDPQSVRLEKIEKRFQGWIGALARESGFLDEVILLNKTTAAHSFYLKETAQLSRFLMSDAEEELAADLSLSGANAWTKLHGVIISQLKADMELEGEVKELPLSLLSTYISDPDESTRERALKAQEQALASAREPLAACLNGLKGSVGTLNDRRGRTDALHDSLDKSRIDRQVLETMLEAMESAFPLLRRYLKAKARLLGKDRLEQWDFPAPVGDTDRLYEWDEAKELILSSFATYSPGLAALASKAFDRGWIDAEPRDGKQVGGFCMRLPAAKESRILFNYDGRLGRVATLAHELGHAYHNECLRGKTTYQAVLPMTLAETASIFCESIVTDAILEGASGPNEELVTLESFLRSASVLTLYVYSRYQFELEIFDQRKKAELSADDFCQLTSQVYRQTLGDAIAEGDIRPYDWAILPHYYLADLSFYNYPYTFGFLFSLGLYQLYQQGRPGFHKEYDQLLAESGMAPAFELGQRMGIDIRQPDFWAGGYQIVRKRVERFEELVSDSVPVV